MSNGPNDKAFDAMNSIIGENENIIPEGGEVSAWFPKGQFLGMDVPKGTSSIIDGLVFAALGTPSAGAVKVVQKKLSDLTPTMMAAVENKARKEIVKEIVKKHDPLTKAYSKDPVNLSGVLNRKRSLEYYYDRMDMLKNPAMGEWSAQKWAEFKTARDLAYISKMPHEGKRLLYPELYEEVMKSQIPRAISKRADGSVLKPVAKSLIPAAYEELRD